MGSFLVAVGKCLADYESKIRNIKILKLILPVAIIVLYVEGILVSKIDSECIKVMSEDGLSKQWKHIH